MLQYIYDMFSRFKKISSIFKITLVIALALFAVKISAQTMTSTNFEIEHPQFILEGGISSSSSFQYFSGTGQFSLGESTSSSFIDRLGFLFFPIATTPVVTATSGDTQVVLDWTSSTGTLANITDYQVGQSVTVDGTYVYTSVGNILTSTRTGLTNNVTYYFKIRAYASGIMLAESSAVSATPVAATAPGGGGGGGGGGSDGDTEIVVFGKAYPNSTITILRDGRIAATTVSGSDASFRVQISGISPGNYTIGAYATDRNGIKSQLQTFPVTVDEGVTVTIGSIFIAPSITADKSHVKQGDNITFFGQATPVSTVTISVHSAQEFFQQTTTDASGIYLNSFDTSQLEIGDHDAKSKVASAGLLSDYGKAFEFVVGNENVPINPNQKCPAKADLNSDCKVNLIDFSIAAFWYQRTLNASGITFDKTKLNGDGKVNLVDFSIMAFYWTG